jgi:UDP-GlcNAc:undecaprenyl-phosphate GlcNAc-1-phosphate transferase
MAEVRDRDVHAIPTPRLGGVAMYVGLLASLQVARHLPALSGVFHTSSEPAAVAVAGGLICLLGVVDDRWGLDALTKLAGQIAAAGVMVLMGVQLSNLPLPGGNTLVLDAQLSVPLTVLLTVALINAVNMVDGLDGLAAGTVAIAGLASFAYSYQLSNSHGFTNIVPSTLLAAILAGICVGFLPHNFNPARIFLGDSGSMLIGLVLAAAAISTTSRTDTQTFSTLGTAVPLIMPLIMPLAVLAIPLLDMVLAVVRRTRKGLNPFSTPDKMHLHHRLLEIGHTQRRAVIIMYVWTALLTFIGVGRSFLSAGTVFIVAIVMVIAAVALMVTPRIRRRIDGGAPHVHRAHYQEGPR